MISFSPHQIGAFEVTQIIDIIGTGVDKSNVNVLKTSTKSFHQMYLTLLGVCKSKRKSIVFTINPGKKLKTKYQVIKCFKSTFLAFQKRFFLLF